MKKYMLIIAASLVAGALVTGCGSPPEGNTDGSAATTGETKPTGTSPADSANPATPPAEKK